MNDKVLFICDINHVSNKVLTRVFDMVHQQSRGVTVLIIYNKTSLYFGDYGNQASPLLYLENDIRVSFVQQYKALFGKNSCISDLNQRIDIRFANSDSGLKQYIDNYNNWLFEHQSLATRLNQRTAIPKQAIILNKAKTKERSLL